MTLWTMIVAVVAVVMISVIIMQWIATKEKIAKAHAKAADGQSDGRIASLEKRVAVLERLATDKGQQLKDEIDAL
ncbi:hypothetical protein ACFO5Q_09420 [Kordiimonas lipolytica]|uniref:Phage shock protein B n=1 Tax=Kordiimonas lipolytica TaxID=1662421 RepID=A0ABV8UB63_9PROT|nr:hypothetical protein [Kordiimonas lipolytica]